MHPSAPSSKLSYLPDPNVADHRREVYYWKCDRPSIMENSGCRSMERKNLEERLKQVVGEKLGLSEIELKPGVGQGNHLTYTCRTPDKDLFIRVENGPEGDCFMDIETAIISRVGEQGVPVPHVYAADASRVDVPFAWQILEKIPCKDLASLGKTEPLAELEFATVIGAEVAKWQRVKISGYGPFSIESWRRRGVLDGLHAPYRDYFYLQLPRHLKILRDKDLLSHADSEKINSLFREFEDLLHLESPCLVHKDLAFWNILGEPGKIHAFIDWEDAIGGDPMDDFSLLGCFHSGNFIMEALRGYRSEEPLPPDYIPRFWLHLLRNMIMKAVIRVISGFFEKHDDFFLIAKGSSGHDLREFTCRRIITAMEGLETQAKIETL